MQLKVGHGKLAIHKKCVAIALFTGTARIGSCGRSATTSRNAMIIQEDLPSERAETSSLATSAPRFEIGHFDAEPAEAGHGCSYFELRTRLERGLEVVAQRGSVELF